MREPIRARISARQLDAVTAEIAQEKAASLRRIADRLESALTALRHHDLHAELAPPREPDPRRERDRLVASAAEALWFYIVQREACGLRDTENLLHELGIPNEIVIRLGVSNLKDEL
jgi:hypothetical protein